MSEACGFKNDDIMFSSNVTPAAEYKKAKELGAYINAAGKCQCRA